MVAVDPDLKPVLIKMLSGLDRDPNTPHVLIPSDAGFAGGGSSSPTCSATCSRPTSRTRTTCAAGVFEPFGQTDLTGDSPEGRVVMYLSALAESLPDHVGSLVVVLDPKKVEDPPEFRKAPRGWPPTRGRRG